MVVHTPPPSRASTHIPPSSMDRTTVKHALCVVLAPLNNVAPPHSIPLPPLRMERTRMTYRIVIYMNCSTSRRRRWEKKMQFVPQKKMGSKSEIRGISIASSLFYFMHPPLPSLSLAYHTTNLLHKQERTLTIVQVNIIVTHITLNYNGLVCLIVRHWEQQNYVPLVLGKLESETKKQEPEGMSMGMCEIVRACTYECKRMETRFLFTNIVGKCEVRKCTYENTHAPVWLHQIYSIITNLEMEHAHERNICGARKAVFKCLPPPSFPPLPSCPVTKLYVHLVRERHHLMAAICVTTPKVAEFAKRMYAPPTPLQPRLSSHFPTHCLPPFFSQCVG